MPFLDQSSLLVRQFSRFAMVGVVGFCVDAGVLDFLVAREGANPYSARLVSFLIAATATWWLNRLLTFRSERPGTLGEWGKYAGFMTFGAALNIGTYSAVIWMAGSARSILWVALASGSGSGMLVNFFTARRLLHRPDQTYSTVEANS